jgi:CGNR zinc finger/Putative stress-induced transcription regulator
VSRLGPKAPGAVALRSRLTIDQVLWVANTRHGPAGHWHARVRVDSGDHDHLQAPGDAVAYLAAHRVPLPDGMPDPTQLRWLSVVREGIRALLDPVAPGLPPDALALLETARFRVQPEGRLVSAAEGWDGFIDDLIPPLLEVVEERARLRSCGNPLCRLVFLDQSRNRSRRWCDSAGCGNRNRVRRHRMADRPLGGGASFGTGTAARLRHSPAATRRRPGASPG